MTWFRRERKCPACGVRVGTKPRWCASCNEFAYTNQQMTEKQVIEHLRRARKDKRSPYAGVGF